MAEDRLREVLRVREEALARGGAERAVYLDSACAGDAELRREVESQLASRRAELEDYLESRPLTLEAPALAVGERLGPYEVVGPPLPGGMGTVYRARDARLGRSVALKVLGGSRGMTPAARDRFKREARAIAALDHPNICALYDVGSTRQGGAAGRVVEFLVMEYLHGETLHHRLRTGRGGRAVPLPIDEALTYGIQIADALATAHEAGFVHRDLKPSNIMLVAPGPGRGAAVHAKLLDFGLAKHAPVSGLESGSTVSAELATTPGTVLGTLGYLSPEQARGEDVDARSDLFAFGTVLFEMVTGRPAFVRASSAEALAAVLTDDPPPPSTLNPAVSASFDAVVEKALDKDRELRYQSAAEIRGDLKRLQRERLRHTPIPSPGLKWWKMAAVATLTASAAIAVVIGASGSGIPDFEPSPLTHGRGVESEPAISPDGTFVAFTREEDKVNQEVWVLDRRDGRDRNLSNHPSADHHPSWLPPDGSQVLFVSDRTGQPSVFRAPFNGGIPTPVLENADEVAVSPDGTRFAFTRAVEAFGRIFVAELAHPDKPTQLTFTADGPGVHQEPAWSPDGKTIAYNAQGETWTIPARGGRGRRVSVNDDFEADPVWSRDGRFLYYSSTRDGGLAIWRNRARDAPWLDRLAFWRPHRAIRVSRTSGTEQQPALSHDGRLLAFSTLRQDADLAFVDVRTGQRTTWGTMEAESCPALASDGRRVFFTSRARPPFFQVWGRDILPSGEPAGEPFCLTDHKDGHASHTVSSRDGRWVAYWLGRDRSSAIWSVAATGGTPMQITDGPRDVLPDWSPGGDRIVYIAQTDGKGDIWTVPVHDGHRAGQPAQVTSGPADDDAPVWSLDGSLIAFRRVSKESDRLDVWVVRPDGSGEQRVTDSVWARRVGWDPVVPDALLVAGRWAGPTSPIEIRRISRYPGRNAPPFTPIRMDLDELADFSMTKDGHLLVFAKYNHQGSIWLWRARGFWEF
jgi:eukaryotic-like serine/threonine-protein kinase